MLINGKICGIGKKKQQHQNPIEFKTEEWNFGEKIEWN